MSTAAEPVTAEAVGQLFRDCWPNMHRYPDAAACQFVAIPIRIVRDRPRNKHPDKPPPTAVKHARLFLQHAREMDAKLQGERAVLEPTIFVHGDGARELQFVDLARYDKNAIAIARLADAQRSVRDALEAWETRDPWFWEGEEPLRWIARHAEDAWARTNRVQTMWGKCAERPAAKLPALGRYEGSALCIFVQKALALIGLRVGDASVSAVLLGKQKACRLLPLDR